MKILDNFPDSIEFEFEVRYSMLGINKTVNGTFTTYKCWELADFALEDALRRKFNHLLNFKIKRKRTVSILAGVGFDTKYPSMNYIF